MSGVDNIYGLHGKVCVVTGASTGIGLACVKALVQNGAIVIGLSKSGRIHPDAGALEIEVISCDVSVERDAMMVAAHIAGKYSEIYALINAAGITLPHSLEDDPVMRSRDFQKTIDVNLAGTFLMTRSLRSLIASGGSIVNIASIGGHQGFPDNPAYAASKAGVIGLSRALAVDFGKYDIRVNSISPGYIKTNMTQLSYMDPVKRFERESRTILGRFGEPEEVANLAVFLSSSLCSYITGSDIAVDGGWLAKGL